MDRAQRKTRCSESCTAFFKEGEIWWCSVGENIGVEISGKSEYFSRPVYIYKKLNQESFLGFPMTTQKKKGTWYVAVKQESRDVVVIIGQARTLSSKRLQSKVGHLDDSDKEKVLRGFERLFLKSFPPLSPKESWENPKNTRIVSQNDNRVSSEYTERYMQEIKLGTWRHFKGHTVQVVGVAKNSENYDEEFVVYHHPDKDGKDQMWIRPVAMFLETVERDGKTMKRFEYLGN